MNIALIGLKSCGKSTVGPLLAKALGYQCIDTDTLIEDYFVSQGHKHTSFKLIHQTVGEDEFRRIETYVLQSALPTLRDTVVCTGGGTLLNPVNTELLKHYCQVIHLDVTQSELAKRWQQSPPGFIDSNQLEQQLHDYYQNRQPLMIKVADLTIACDEMTPDEITSSLLKVIANRK